MNPEVLSIYNELRKKDRYLKYSSLQLLAEGRYGPIFYAEIEETGAESSGTGKKDSSPNVKRKVQKFILRCISTEESRLRGRSDIDQVLQRLEKTFKKSRPVARILAIDRHSLSDLGYIVFVQEYIPGSSWRKIVKERYGKVPMSHEDRRFVNIFTKMLKAVAFLHRKKYYHLDLHPEEFKVAASGGTGNFKLVNWGHGVFEEKNRRPIKHLAYKAPELWENPEKVDQRADVYSMGMILYEALAGRLPFDLGQDEESLKKTIAEGDFKNPQEYNPLVGKRFGEIIKGALHPNPDLREFQTIGQFKRKIKRWSRPVANKVVPVLLIILMIVFWRVLSSDKVDVTVRVQFAEQDRPKNDLEIVILYEEVREDNKNNRKAEAKELGKITFPASDLTEGSLSPGKTYKLYAACAEYTTKDEKEVRLPKDTTKPIERTIVLEPAAYLKLNLKLSTAIKNNLDALREALESQAKIQLFHGESLDTTYNTYDSFAWNPDSAYQIRPDRYLLSIRSADLKNVLWEDTFSVDKGITIARPQTGNIQLTAHKVILAESHPAIEVQIGGGELPHDARLRRSAKGSETYLILPLEGTSTEYEFLAQLKAGEQNTVCAEHSKSEPATADAIGATSFDFSDKTGSIRFNISGEYDQLMVKNTTFAQEEEPVDNTGNFIARIGENRARIVWQDGNADEEFVTVIENQTEVVRFNAGPTGLGGLMLNTRPADDLESAQLYKGGNVEGEPVDNTAGSVRWDFGLVRPGEYTIKFHRGDQEFRTGPFHVVVDSLTEYIWDNFNTDPSNFRVRRRTRLNN